MELTRVQLFAVIFFFCIIFLICFCITYNKIKKYIVEKKLEKYNNNQYSDNNFIHNTYYTNLP